jgi:hypothetical protein
MATMRLDTLGCFSGRETARLAGLDIEIIHSRSPSDDAEQISINMQAVPSWSRSAVVSRAPISSRCGRR